MWCERRGAARRGGDLGDIFISQLPLCVFIHVNCVGHLSRREVRFQKEITKCTHSQLRCLFAREHAIAR